MGRDVPLGGASAAAGNLPLSGRRWDLWAGPVLLWASFPCAAQPTVVLYRCGPRFLLLFRRPLWDLYQNSQTLTHAACCPTGTSIAKTYGGPMGYGRRAQARTVPRMSQCLRSLVLAPLAPLRCGAFSVSCAVASHSASPLYGNLSPASAGLFHAGPPRSAQPTARLGVGVVGLLTFLPPGETANPVGKQDCDPNLAPLPGGAFSASSPARCAISCGIVSMGLPLSQAASPLYGNLSPASTGLFLWSGCAMLERACRPTSSESPTTSLMDVAGLASPPSPSVECPAPVAGLLFGAPLRRVQPMMRLRR